MVNGFACVALTGKARATGALLPRPSLSSHPKGPCGAGIINASARRDCLVYISYSMVKVGR